MENTKRYCLTLDLKEDPALIEAYERHHRQVWPEVVRSIQAAGIRKMEIYRYQTRLCMIIETSPEFSFEAKASADAQNEKVQAWEKLMETYQQPLPGESTEKWKRMERVFDLPDKD